MAMTRSMLGSCMKLKLESYIAAKFSQWELCRFASAFLTCTPACFVETGHLSSEYLRVCDRPPTGRRVGAVIQLIHQKSQVAPEVVAICTSHGTNPKPYSERFQSVGITLLRLRRDGRMHPDEQNRWAQL